MLKPGEKQKLKVLRKTDIGYMLVTKGQEEVFLHNNETNFLKIREGSSVDAFLFYDNKGRLAATLYDPIITKDKSGWLKVTGINKKIGVFLDNGINKDILFSKDDLPSNQSLWPYVGDKLYVKLVVNKNFLAKPSQDRNNELENLETGSSVLTRVINLGDKGLTLLTENLTQIFVDSIQLRKPYRLGEEVEVMINFEHDQYYSGQLLLKKEEQRLDDADLILNHLKQVKKMNLTSNSSPEDIKEVFNMSKKAFKRALGALYKQRIIDFKDDMTVLVGEENE